jgi:PAS domain S-box-containing protein
MEWLTVARGMEESTSSDRQTTRKQDGRRSCTPRERGAPTVSSLDHPDVERSKDWALSGAETSFLRALIQQNPLAVVVLDENQRIQMCNPAFERMFLFQSVDVRGASLDELVTSNKEMWIEANELTQGILAGHAVSRITKRSRTDGSLIDVEINALPLVAGNKVIGAYALYQDITEQKRSIQALRESEERYRGLFERNLAGVFRTGFKEGRILDCNDAFARIFGYESREEILRQSAWNLHLSTSAREQVINLLLKKGTLTNYEVCLRRKDGRPVWVLENIMLFRGENGAPDVSEGTIVDITAQKQAELALRQLSDRLMEVQDEERRRMARELHDMIGQSLAVVTMYLSVLKQSEGVLNPAAQVALSESTQLAEQCSREIRTFSYLLHPPLLEEVGLVSTLRWYAAGFSKRSGITLEVQLPKVLGRLPVATETALLRVVQESLTNVLRHSGSSTAKIRLMRGARVITLEVLDRGKGIRRGILNHRHGHIPALGVGIAGMRERMKQLGGDLEIESGKTGTIVRATLPIVTRRSAFEDAHTSGRRPRHRTSRSASPDRGTIELGSVRRGRKRP